MATSTDSTAKYFARYAEPEAQLASQIADTYAAAIVVPLCREEATFLAGYENAFRAARGRVLLIAVVNGAEGASAETHARNSSLLAALAHRFEGTVLSAAGVTAGAWLGQAENFDCLCLDRASAGKLLPRGEGVGLARKIGADLAAALCIRGRVACQYVGCSDADATLPADYCARLASADTRASALLWPFRHTPSGDASIDLATVLYEISLRYYVLGLAAAGSPYAYQSIGSSLAFDAKAYASVRGFPRREAAEDFYLLDKLAKVSPLVRLAGEPIELRARASDRVPFGTGRRTGEIAAACERGAGFELYAPRLFGALGAVIAGLNAFAATGDEKALRAHVEATQGELAPAVLAVLEQSKTFAALEQAAQQAPVGPVLARRIHTWFDALRTLRFVHLLRDACLPSVPWLDALREGPFTSGVASQATPEGICAQLAEMEARLPIGIGPTAR